MDPSGTNHDHEEDDSGEVFLNEEDILHEMNVDDEELPEADEDDLGSDRAGADFEYNDEDDSMHTFTGHTGELYAVVCSPTDPSLVATGGGDDKGFLWRIGQGDWAFELQGHNDSLSTLVFSNDGLLLASGSLDGVIKVWDMPSGNLRCTLDGPAGGIEWLRWHPRGHLLLAGSEDSTLWMWNADKGAYLNMFTGHASSVTCGDFTPDGKTICSGSDDATLRVWNPQTGDTLHVVRGHPYHTEGLTCMAMKTGSAGSTLAITGSKDGSVHIVNINTGKVVTSLIAHLDPAHPETAHSDSVECVGFAPSSLWAATGGLDQKLIIWDLDHSVPRSVCDHPDGVTCLTWIGSSRYVATGCLDGKVRVWDSLSGQCARTFSGHLDAIQALAASANLDFIVSSSLDGTARVFEIHELK
uniref:Angio-associated migratory cell protein n=1 Tax=Kalanchoe fedtschenkoi TaxID=63787 RepID=A0A7N0UP15_KALFE